MNEFKEYLVQQRRFLLDPGGWVKQRFPPKGSLEQPLPPTGSAWASPLAYLTTSALMSIAFAQVNVNLFGERIQRIATLPESVAGSAETVVAVLLISAAAHLCFRPITQSRASYSATIQLFMYAMAFVLPAITVVLIAATRIGSLIVGQTILFIPPARALGLGGALTDLKGLTVAGSLEVLALYWNIYFGWLIWSASRKLHQTSGVSAFVALLISVGTVYAASPWISEGIHAFIRVVLPIWEATK